MRHKRGCALVLPVAHTLATSNEGLVAHTVGAWRSHARGFAKAQAPQEGQLPQDPIVTRLNQGPSLLTTKPSKTRAVDGRVSQRRPRNKIIYASSERLVSKSSFSGEGLWPPIRVEAGKWTGEEVKKVRT